MIISFAGMSSVGKSYWADRLQKEKDYQKYSCDESIEKKMASEPDFYGYKGTAGLARWMGQPGDERYAENSRRYLELETEVLSDILSRIETGGSKNFVVDTTGSVIYQPPELLRALKRLTKVIYFEMPASMIGKMTDRYLDNGDPKPVIWGDLYRPNPGENKKEALRRCYPALLLYRSKLYEMIADIKVSGSLIDQKTAVNDLLKIIAGG